MGEVFFSSFCLSSFKPFILRVLSLDCGWCESGALPYTDSFPNFYVFFSESSGRIWRNCKPIWESWSCSADIEVWRISLSLHLCSIWHVYCSLHFWALWPHPGTTLHFCLGTKSFIKKEVRSDLILVFHFTRIYYGETKWEIECIFVLESSFNSNLISFGCFVWNLMPGLSYLSRCL